MKSVAKTDFSKMSSAELAAEDNVLLIISVTTPVGYFVPVNRMEEITTTCRDALRVLENGVAPSDAQMKTLQYWLSAVVEEMDGSEGEGE